MTSRTLYTYALRTAVEHRNRADYSDALCTLMRVHSQLIGRTADQAATQAVHWFLDHGCARRESIAAAAE